MMVGEKEKLKQKRYNEFYMDIAHRVSQMSYAERLKVGSILVKDGNIISFGWNGMPAGWDNNCEEKNVVQEKISTGVFKMTKKTELKTRPEVLHAEQNTLMKVTKSTNSSEDADMFITHAPCIECAKSIFQSGIRRIFYKDTYRSEDGINFLQKCDVEVIRV
jgi:dCMP deaminase